jgi:5-methylcytosine-specific restriction endonuclease McrA
MDDNGTVMEYKKCICCKTIKHIVNFAFRKDTKKYRNQCKECMNKKTSIYKKNLRKNDPEFVKTERNYCKKWRDGNLEYISNKQKRWRAENLDYDKNYYNKNNERLLSQKGNWRKENPATAKAICKRYRKKHPETKRMSERKRRALKKGIKENYSKRDEQITLQMFENKCFNCGSEQNLTIDHHFCLNNGNPLTLKNAVVLCQSCNSKKNDKNPEFFYSDEQLDKLKRMGIGG